VYIYILNITTLVQRFVQMGSASFANLYKTPYDIEKTPYLIAWSFTKCMLYISP
jgi:hypothetical protein